jgi:acetolactate synthase-1/2/3 large subunit
MHFVAALDRVEGMRRVLGLFEGVVTGAADGYARMTGNPAATSCIRTSCTTSWWQLRSR